MTGFAILDPVKDAERWRDIMLAMPSGLRDVHFSPEYAAAQSLLGVEPFLAVYSFDRYYVAQPFALRRSSVGGMAVTDLSNLQGYGGPVSNHGPALYAWFAKEFREWCAREGIVSEFCALHPLMVDHQRRLLGSEAVPVFRKEVVVVQLRPGVFPSSGYRDRRVAGLKAAKNWGVAAAIEDDPTPFIDLYQRTMVRRKAPARWILPEAFLRALCKIGSVFVARIGGEPESAGLMLRGNGGNAYYHLAGNALTRPKAGANDALINEMICHAWTMGDKCFHLGGGPTSDDVDPVLQFKAGFSDGRAQAWTYFRVLDQRAYDALCAAKVDEERAAGAELSGGFLPMYRREAT